MPIRLTIAALVIVLIILGAGALRLRSVQRDLDVESARAEAMNAFITQLLANEDAAGRPADVDGVLEAAGARIDDLAATNPDAAAALRGVLERSRGDLEDRVRRGRPKRAPFSALRWVEGRPVARVGDDWYGLIAIDGTPVDDVLAFCEKHFPGRARKRFGEDLVQVLAEMGDAPGETVTLELRDLESDRALVREGVPMTAANRNEVRDFDEADFAPPPIEREHGEGAERFRFLTERAHEGRDEPARIMSAEAAAADLAELEAHLVDRWSYLKRTGIDHAAALDTLRAALGDGIGVKDLAIQIQKLLALFGDGHAGVRGREDIMGGPFADVLLAATGDRVVAFLPDRSGLLDAQHPYVRAIDGVPIAAWIDAAASLGTDGSRQLRRGRALRDLRHLACVARELDHRLVGNGAGGVAYELESDDGASSVVHMVGLTAAKPRYGVWPRTASARRDDGIGYLRLPMMDRVAVSHVRAMMPQLVDTEGLVIDVRGNGGGSREALLELAPYLLAPDAQPVVANVAAYRLSPAFPREHLAARFMYRADDPFWSDPHRGVIAAFAPGFRPEWTLPPGEFSAWHYLVLDRSRNPDAPHYGGPVVVLVNGECFSATDIFLGALERLPNVTLLGTPSAGGSGRATSVRLASSGLGIRLSSMASFRPDGRLYDGRGIEPDIVVEPAPTDFTGATDTQLDAALRVIKLNAGD